MIPSELLQYVKDGGLIGAFSLFLWFMWKTQTLFTETLLKFQCTMDKMVENCNRRKEDE